MSIYSTGVNPFSQQLTTTSNILQYNSSKYTLNTSNDLISNITSIKQLIDGTSNVKIDSSGLQIYHKDIIIPLNDGWVNVESRLETDKNDIITIKANISGIDSTITTIEGEIGTLQGEIATNTADIIANNGITTANTGAIVANGIITTANTIAIVNNTLSIGNCLTKSMVQSGDIGIYDAGLLLNLIYNTTQFFDAVILGNNRSFTLQPLYANLPTTKNNKITWNSPLNYNISTDTASIDLSNYLTSIQTSNIVFNNFITSNTFNYILPTLVTNVGLSNQLYVSSNTLFNNVMPNYVTNVGLSNQLYISSNTLFSKTLPNYVTNVGLSNQLYVSSNTLFSNTLPNYVTNNSLANQQYISSNTVANLYISSNVASNILLNYATNTYLSNQQYISSNTVANLYISSNVASNILLNYATNTYLSNQQYISSNTVANLYISSNVASNILLNYATNTYLSNQFYISSNVLKTILTPYTTSNEIYYKQNVYSNEMEYPPKIYDSLGTATTTTFLGKTVQTIEFTLNTALYGNGTYQVYNSTVYSPKFMNLLFDKLTSTYGQWGFNYTQPAGYYNSTNYIVEGYTGEWVIIKFPSPLILTRYKFRYSLLPRAPSLFRFYGSTDGVNFTLIPEASNDTVALTTTDYPFTIYEKILNSSFNTPYLYIGFCCNKLVGNDAIASSLTLQEFYIYCKEYIETLTLPVYTTLNAVNNLYVSSNVIPNYLLPYDKIIDRQNAITSLSNTYVSSNVLSTTLLPYLTSNHLYLIQDAFSSERQYPPKAYNSTTGETTTTFLGKTVYTQTMTLDTTGITYGSGSYTIYSSTTYGDILKNLLFDYNLNNPAGAGFQGSQYLTPAGTYNGTNYIVAGYTGDWIIIKFPTNSVILTKFVFKERVTLNSRAPAEWKCYGSNDGLSFVEITQASQMVRLVAGAYVNGFYTKSFINSTAYQYIGFTINKVIGGVNSDMINISELQLFGYEQTTPFINPIYISSNVIPNILLPYDKTIDRLNAVSGLADIYINSNNFYRGSNINLDKSVKILTNINSNIFNDGYLIVGDGGRLTINGKYGIQPTLKAYSCIGVGDWNETNGGLTNTCISLYEKGMISYHGFSATTHSHYFNGATSMPSLSIASTVFPISSNLFNIANTILGDDTGKMTMNSLVVNGPVTTNGNITTNGVISGGSIVATSVISGNIGVKTPIQFTTSRLISVNEGSSSANYYLYDIDLRKYTKQVLLGLRNFRQFRIRVWEADGNFEFLGDIRQTPYTIFMSDYNGLSIRSYSDFLYNQDLSRLDPIFSHTLVRNNFNYISYASRLAPQTVYMIIEDLL